MFLRGHNEARLVRLFLSVRTLAAARDGIDGGWLETPRRALLENRIRGPFIHSWLHMITCRLFGWNEWKTPLHKGISLTNFIQRISKFTFRMLDLRDVLNEEEEDHVFLAGVRFASYRYRHFFVSRAWKASTHRSSTNTKLSCDNSIKWFRCVSRQQTYWFPIYSVAELGGTPYHFWTVRARKCRRTV